MACNREKSFLCLWHRKAYSHTLFTGYVRRVKVARNVFLSNNRPYYYSTSLYLPKSVFIANVIMLTYTSVSRENEFGSRIKTLTSDIIRSLTIPKQNTKIDADSKKLLSHPVKHLQKLRLSPCRNTACEKKNRLTISPYGIVTGEGWFPWGMDERE